MFDIVTLARIQFAMTTVFHFFFVPFSIGLALVVAIMETMYVVKKRNVIVKWPSFGEIYSIKLRCWGCNRDYSRISVWDELV